MRQGVIPGELIEDTTATATNLRLSSWLVFLDRGWSELHRSVLVVVLGSSGLLIVELLLLLLDQLGLEGSTEVSRPLRLGWGEDWLGWLRG